MGFDLTGESGNYFRANIWSWRPILQLIEETCILSPEVVVELNYNSGQAVTEDEAKRLGFAINELVGSREDSFQYEVIHPREATGIFRAGELLTKAMVARGAHLKDADAPMYATTAEHVREFSRFCRDSGGFKVW